jgi:hypothetical protein
MGFAKPLGGELRNPDWPALSLEWFGVEPLRGGYGTKFINALKDWCDYSGHRLLIADVISNPYFWDQFKWLENEYTEADDQLTYHPNLGTAYQRRTQGQS